MNGDYIGNNRIPNGYAQKSPRTLLGPLNFGTRLGRPWACQWKCLEKENHLNFGCFEMLHLVKFNCATWNDNCYRFDNSQSNSSSGIFVELEEATIGPHPNECKCCSLCSSCPPSLYWLDLRPQLCVALANLNKNQTSRDLGVLMESMGTLVNSYNKIIDSPNPIAFTIECGVVDEIWSRSLIYFTCTLLQCLFFRFSPNKHTPIKYTCRMK